MSKQETYRKIYLANYQVSEMNLAVREIDR